MAKFGYADPGRSGSGDFNKAIRRFQKYFHLKMTGQLDAETQTEMLKPRCGNPDEVDDTGRSGPQAFTTGSKWSKTSLTYRFLRDSEDVSSSVMKATFTKAFAYWSAVTPLRFREVTSGRSDFTISVNGDNVNGQPGIDLLAVAVHEIGHAIGLHHSNVRGSIMWPSYNGYDPNLKLHSDDISGAQSLYGRNTSRNTRSNTGRNIGRISGGGSSCADKNTNCSSWRSSGYCRGRFAMYMKENCPKSCRHC
ncbi:50 kDa hatching enzyme-like [Paramuricea clavata]|uniref:50 kDa hatching enzyme-like n=1 Tax=Paramuricea clavata TaxID=317549 RepID=A0A6S7JBE2_PARCT|nr:50 kDa hatching enzyme-like [Paramuricea clavata]